jgi:hypothetical protein
MSIGNFTKFSLIIWSVLALASCASVKPMSNKTISEYQLKSDFELFKSYQYFVSRDIVLTSVGVKTKIQSGQGYLEKELDVLQLLSSTPGVVREVKAVENDILLGINFDPNNPNDVLWFRNAAGKQDGYYYLAYNNVSEKIVRYGDKDYVVKWEKASGIGAGVKRIFTTNKAKKEYENMEPFLLYEEKGETTETRRTLGGTKL